MISYSVYVVDDEESITDAALLTFGKLYRMKAFSNAEDALAAVREDPPDLVLLDVGLPGMNGIEALRAMKKISPETCVIMITAYEEVETVVSAMRLGAYDYVLKPFQMDALEVNVANALESIRLRKEVQLLQEQYLNENVPCFIAESDAIQSVMHFVESVSKSPDTPVLILGETGTGKELIAKAVHYKSPNYRGPFVALNCAAIPKDLLESELFGYEKGAFSGAHASGKKGMVEEASGGTLFLDEVGDLSPEAQAKLLRFLEAGEYYRVGSTKKLRASVRIVSATNKELESMIDKGLFREDLYHRLAVTKVRLPSLHERPEDILPIAGHFLIEFSRKFGKTFTGISPQSEVALMRRKWRGNVRELRNLIEKEVLMGTGPLLTLSTLDEPEKNDRNEECSGRPPAPPFSPEGLDVQKILRDLERYYFREAIRTAGGNLSEAARLLNMSYYSFRRHKEKLNL